MRRFYCSLLFFSALFSACSVNTGTLNNTAANTSPANNTQPAAENKTAAAGPQANVANAAPKQAKVDKPKKQSANSTERIQFAAGKTDGYWTRDIPANGSIDFVINAKKGQTMGYTIGYDFKDSDLQGFLTEPGLQDISQTANPKETKEFTINKTGDHRLTVNNMSSKKVTFTLYLDIN